MAKKKRRKDRAHYDESVKQIVDATFESMAGDEYALPKRKMRKRKKELKKFVKAAPDAFAGAPESWF